MERIVGDLLGEGPKILKRSEAHKYFRDHPQSMPKVRASPRYLTERYF